MPWRFEAVLSAKGENFFAKYYYGVPNKVTDECESLSVLTLSLVALPSYPNSPSEAVSSRVTTGPHDHEH